MNKTNDLKQALAHVLWIGGATDAGKTTVAVHLAMRHGWHIYHYDRYDLPHHERLAEGSERYRAFLDASLDERWLVPEPEALLERSMQSFQDRFPLVIEELHALPADNFIIAEGFGLLPELVAPLLSSPHQAIWLIPTESFKRASMARRNKPSFAAEMSDPARAKENLFRRDMLLVELVRRQARSEVVALLEVDDAAGEGELTAMVEAHLAPYLATLGSRAKAWEASSLPGKSP
jgi:2-phosphoglycerate kinase